MREVGVAIIVAMLLLALAIGSISKPSAGSAVDQEGAKKAASDAAVPWGDYAPAVRTRVDAAVAGKDCRALQAEFDLADANNAATRARTGRGNVALMQYLDGAMRVNGCYGKR